MHIEKTTSAGNATKQKQDCLQSTAFSPKSRPVFAKRLLAVYTKNPSPGHVLPSPVSPHIRESRNFFAFVIRNTAQRFRIPTNDRNLESKFHWQRLESSTWNPESTAWNLESKTVLDSLAWGDLYILPYRRSVRPHSTAAHRIDVAAEKVGRTLIDISTNSI